MLVTDSLGAVSRTVLETTRTLFVWVLNLLLFYAQPAKGMQMGEPWTAHSWLQACGFGVLVVGTLAYGEAHLHRPYSRVCPGGGAAAAAAPSLRAVLVQCYVFRLGCYASALMRVSVPVCACRPWRGAERTAPAGQAAVGAAAGIAGRTGAADAPGAPSPAACAQDCGAL